MEVVRGGKSRLGKKEDDMINEYERFLKRLSEDQLSNELSRQRNRENSYANSQAAHDAAIFFGMTSYRSGDAWKITACERELARRRG